MLESQLIKKYIVVMSILTGVLAGIIAFQFSSRIPRPELRDSAVGAIHRGRDSGLGTPKPSVVYRKSLIPGGVSDAAALRTAVLRDPVLAAAFRDFDWNAAAPCVVPAGEFFVSYRLGDQIRWTTLPGSLAGQGCITDGRQTVLTRCGNLISFVPQSPAGTETPGSLSIPEAIPAIEFRPISSPSIDEKILAAFPPSVASNPSVVYTPILPVVPISVVYLPPTTTTPPTVQVPEPSTTHLVLIGLIFVALVVRGAEIRRHKRRK